MSNGCAPARRLLAGIAASDLPVPVTVRLYADTGTVALHFAHLADGIAWCDHLGGTVTTSPAHDGFTHLITGRITWQGWHVNLFAADPTDTTGGDHH